MAGHMKWWLGLAVIALVIALTAIDKNDEQSCKDREQASPSLRTSDCDGFLPW